MRKGDGFTLRVALILAIVALSCAFAKAEELKCLSKEGMDFYYTDPPKDFVSTFVVLSYQSDTALNGRGPALLEWAQTAAKHHLAFMCLIAKYNQDLFGSCANGTVPPETAEIIKRAAFSVLGTNPKSFCFFPYDSWRDSVLLALGLGGSPDLKVAGWGETNYVPVAFVNNRCPCLLTATDDYLSLPQLKDYYAGQQERTRKASILIYKPFDVAGMKDFVCQYFEATASRSEGQWVDTETNSPVGADDLKKTWMPNGDVAAAWAKLNTQMLPRPTIVEDTVNADSPGIAPLHFYLRLPTGQVDGTKVAGVLAYCTWETDGAALTQDLMVDTNRVGKEADNLSVQMVKYATAHNLALLTWSTPGGWNAQTDSSQLLNSQQSAQNREFQIYSRLWDEGVNHLVRKTGIPPGDYLLYGISRGAQWAHRLALRKPERFLAINIHVSSSYDVPTPEASHCLWLVTTGELEHGYALAKGFYEQCTQQGYPIVFKAEQNLGHNSCIEVEELRNKFFDYALELKKEEADKKLDKDGIVTLAAQRLNASPEFGDILNQDIISPTEAQELPPTLLERLPNEQVAQAWATVHVPEKDSP